MAIGMFWATVCLAIFLAVLISDRMGLFTSKNHFDVHGRTVVITGGSQGMGRGLAKLLAQRGANVVIVARNEQKLSGALKYISSSAKDPSSQRFHTISADLTSPEENTRVLREVTQWNNNQPPDIVWANAGASQPSFFLETSIETLRSQMDTNYWAAAYLAHATLQAWTQPVPLDTGRVHPKRLDVHPRHFIMTSSTAAFAGIAGYSPYTPAKAAMRSLADHLRAEVLLYNGARRPMKPAAGKTALAPAVDIQIHCVFAGSIESPGFANEQKVKHPVTKVLEEGDPKQSEDEVAAAAVKGLEKGGFLVTTQWLGEVMRTGMLGGSARNGWGVRDTILGWIVTFAWLFVGPDLDGKVWKYGRENGTVRV